MTPRTLILTALLALSLVGSAHAQDSEHTNLTPSAIGLPEVCKAAAGNLGEIAKGVHAQTAPPRIPGQMTEAQKGLHQAMTGMESPMMQGMMAKDADVAWMCAMIPHHQGAIDMARVGLKNGDNPEAKKIAEKTIQEQESSIKKLTTWLEQNAKKESSP